LTWKESSGKRKKSRGKEYNYILPGKKKRGHKMVSLPPPAVKGGYRDDRTGEEGEADPITLT